VAQTRSQQIHDEQRPGAPRRICDATVERVVTLHVEVVDAGAPLGILTTVRADEADDSGVVFGDADERIAARSPSRNSSRKPPRYVRRQRSA